MIFFETIKTGDSVKWYDPAWKDLDSRNDVLEHLNSIRTVTDIRTSEPNCLNPWDIVELDNGTQAYAVECINPASEFIFGVHGLKVQNPS